MQETIGYFCFCWVAQEAAQKRKQVNSAILCPLATGLAQLLHSKPSHIKQLFKHFLQPKDLFHGLSAVFPPRGPRWARCFDKAPHQTKKHPGHPLL